MTGRKPDPARPPAPYRIGHVRYVRYVQHIRRLRYEPDAARDPPP